MVELLLVGGALEPYSRYLKRLACYRLNLKTFRPNIQNIEYAFNAHLLTQICQYEYNRWNQFLTVILNFNTHENV